MALSTAAALIAAAVGREAAALQPLEDFVAEALRHGTEACRARAQLAASEAAVAQQRALLLPGLQLRGTYTRNQYAVVLPVELPNQPPRRLTIQPGNQLDGYATLTVPLVNLANFSRLGRAGHARDAEGQRQAAARLSIAADVVEAFYGLLSGVGRLHAAERAVATTERSLRTTEERLAAGSVAELEQRRAQAAVQAQQRERALAELEVVRQARRLQTLSGLTPDLTTAPPVPVDDLAEERPLAAFLAEGERLPAVAAAAEDARAAAAGLRAERLALVPALGGQVQQRLTNVTGFSGGHTAFFSLGVNLTWNGDFGSRANIRAAAAQAELSAVAHRRAALAAADDIYLAWHTVRSNIAQSRAARAAWQFSQQAAEAAGWRYQSDMATHLELLEAQRDSFAAESARVSADAGLVGARIKLRLLSGEAPP